MAQTLETLAERLTRLEKTVTEMTLQLSELVNASGGMHSPATSPIRCLRPKLFRKCANSSESLIYNSCRLRSFVRVWRATASVPRIMSLAGQLLKNARNKCVLFLF